MTDLRHFLDPRRSKLRPYLAYLALQNDSLHKEGNLVGNNPSITWYLKQLKRWNISSNYYGVRKQLLKMAEIGLLNATYIQRPVATRYLGHKRITKVIHAEFHIQQKHIPDVEAALKHILPGLWAFQASKAGASAPRDADRQAHKSPVFV